MPVGLRDIGRQHVKFASFSSGTSALTAVAAVSGKKIVVIQWTISNNKNGAVTWQSDTTDLCGPLELDGDSTITSAWCPDGHFETVVGEALKVTFTGSTPTCSGSVVYFEQA
jgi:hypothetical protein